MQHAPTTTARRSPVIVLGMHRSGTSLLVGLLRDLGLHIGANTPRNNESKLFRRLNLWLLGQSGAHWDNPGDIDKLLELPELRAASEEYLADAISSIRIADYLGWKKWITYRSVYALDFPWGWKDPVNTFTLPFWLDLFPDAKVVHIYRNGVDVAYSMHKRTHSYFEYRYDKWKRHGFYYQLKPLRNRFTSIHTWLLEDCFELWKNYLSRSRQYMDALPSERTFTLQYEEFLDNPAPTLRQLAEFCELQADAKAVENVIGRINPGRAFAFTVDDKKREFALQHARDLERWGYDLEEILR